MKSGEQLNKKTSSEIINKLYEDFCKQILLGNLSVSLQSNNDSRVYFLQNADSLTQEWQRNHFKYFIRYCLAQKTFKKLVDEGKRLTTDSLNDLSKLSSTTQFSTDLESAVNTICETLKNESNQLNILKKMIIQDNSLNSLRRKFVKEFEKSQNKDGTFPKDVDEAMVLVLKQIQYLISEESQSKRISDDDADFIPDPQKIQEVENLKSLSENCFSTAVKLFPRPKTQILGGLMLVLGGLTLMAASAAICAVSFGVLSPVSIGGFVVGASLVHAGWAIAAGIWGIGMVAGGGFKMFDKKPIRKHLEELGKEVNKNKTPR